VTKKISWRVGDVIEYEDKKPRTEIARIVGHVDSESRSWNPSVSARRLRDNEPVELTEREITGRADVIAATAALAHAPLSMRFRHVTQGDHVHVDVFTGPPGATLANAGKLVMRQDEWMTFVLAMTSLGSILPAFDVSFVEHDPGRTSA
jgi:hypothetical protein